jgi:protein gp37
MSYNPWHGCHKISSGCVNCYMFRGDEKFDRDANTVRKTQAFNLPIQKKRDGTFKVKDNSLLFTCLTSDFFIEEADSWRTDVWDMIRVRSDCHFYIITKRIHRFLECIPNDWNDGYDNVTIACTIEDQTQANLRLPLFNSYPIKHKAIICEPLLEKIDLRKYLNNSILEIVVGGESGPNARLCDYDWVLDLKSQAEYFEINFNFKQTGANFKKNNRIYQIKRANQLSQAKLANINHNYKEANYRDKEII